MCTVLPEAAGWAVGCPGSPGGLGDGEVRRLDFGVPVGEVWLGVWAGLPLEGVGLLEPGLLPDAEVVKKYTYLVTKFVFFYIWI